MEHLPIDDLEEMLESAGYFYEDADVYNYTETIFDVWNHCVVPSIASVQLIIFRILTINIIFGAVVSVISVPEVIFHLLSGLAGVYFISSIEFSVGRITILSCFTLSYCLLYLISVKRNNIDSSEEQQHKQIRFLSGVNVAKYSILLVLVLFEYVLLESDVWLEIRGIMMTFTMKFISLAEDIDNGIVLFPTVSQYFGYIFCGGNVLFGPWMPFQEYTILAAQPTKKSLWWFCAIIRALIISLIFLMTSNCFISYFITDDSNSFLVAYKEAFSFRTSHYFICYLSEASMLAAGFRNKKFHDKDKWRYAITDPLKIEFPTALSVIVTHWNRPMHDFLKKYVYKAWLPLGKFYGILATFVVSACLHGFELKVSVVLITIGIFSYIQFSVRNYFAEMFSCCIKVYPCKVCRHKYKRSHLRSRVCQIWFGFSSVLHLMYLGMLMDSSTDDLGIYEKWKNLYFVSFIIMFFNVLIIM